VIDNSNPNLRLFIEQMPTQTEWMGKKTHKPFKKGGFSGTSLDPYFVIARLTERFGPCGIGWGVRLNRAWEVMLPDNAEGKPRSQQYVHCTLWYVLDGTRGEFDCVGGTPIQGFGDEDTLKKGVTDAVTKGASWLGIGGDIYLGRWDDAKYVAEQEQATRVHVAHQAQQSRRALHELAEKVATLLDDAMDADQFHEARRQAIELHPKLQAAGMEKEILSLKAAIGQASVKFAPPKAAE